MCSKPRSTRAYPVGKLMKDKLCSQKATISNQRVFFVFCTYLGFGHLVLYRKDHTNSLINVCEHLILERWGSKRSNLKSKDGGAKEDRELARRCEPGNAACADEGLVTFDVEILVVVIIWVSSSSSWLWPSSPLFSWWHLGNGDPKM